MRRARLSHRKCALVLATAATFVLPGCSNNSAVSGLNIPNVTPNPVPIASKIPAEQSKQAPTETPDENRLRVAIFFDQPGSSFMEDGEPSGFNVDVAAYVAWKLGYSPYEIEWVEARMDRDNMLLDDEVDLVFASYSYSDEWVDKIDYAGPYLVTGQTLGVRADDNSIEVPGDLAGKKVCGPKGSHMLERFVEMVPDAEIVEAKNRSECVRDVINGDVDAITSSDGILGGLAASDEFYDKIKVVGKPFSEELIMVGLPPNSHELCENINVALDEMYNDGSWSKFIMRVANGTDYNPDPELNPPAFMPCK
jgi:glutamate transport system substrate-binding protein